MEILWYGHSVCVLQLLQQAAKVTVLARNSEEALVLGRIRYGDSFPKVFNLECDENDKPTKLPTLGNSKVALAAAAQNESDMYLVLLLAKQLENIFVVIIAVPQIPSDVINADAEVPGWSHCTKEVMWELLGVPFQGKTVLLTMVRKKDKVAKLQMVVDECTKDRIGSNDASYIPQPGSPRSTLEPVAPAEAENKGKRRFEDAILQLESTGDGKSGRPLFIEGDRQAQKRQCLLKPPLCRKRGAVLMRLEHQNFFLGPREFGSYLGWRGHSLNMRLLSDSAARHVLSNTPSKPMAEIILAVLCRVLGISAQSSCHNKHIIE